MKILVDIKQIDNGFIVKMVDEDGEPENDYETFVETFEKAIELVTKWVATVRQWEANLTKQLEETLRGKNIEQG